MSTEQFAYLSELVEQIKATGNPSMAARSRAALSDLLYDNTRRKEEIEAYA